MASRVVVYLVILLLAIGGGVWIGTRSARRLNPGRTVSLHERWRTLAIAAPMLVVALIAPWLIVSGHPAVGIGLLVALLVLPNFVTVPLRIRRARQRAEASRAQRDGHAS